MLWRLDSIAMVEGKSFVAQRFWMLASLLLSSSTGLLQAITFFNEYDIAAFP